MSLNSSYTYLLVNLGALIIPLLFSFHPKIQFYKRWKEVLLSLFLVSIPFIAWDILYTHLGVWGFENKYLLGVSVFNLPIEEILFFYCIPYACVFTYYCFRLIQKEFGYFSIRWVSLFLIIGLLVLGILNFNRLYTSVTFIGLSLLLVFTQFYLSPNWLGRFYLSLVVLILPFLIVNGILTGTAVDKPIVWYNSEEFMGVRLGTIPIEDFFYGFLLILLNVLLIENVGMRGFEPPISRPPDAHFNRTKLHPEI